MAGSLGCLLIQGPTLGIFPAASAAIGSSIPDRTDVVPSMFAMVYVLCLDFVFRFKFVIIIAKNTLI